MRTQISVALGSFGLQDCLYLSKVCVCVWGGINPTFGCLAFLGIS